MPDHVHLVLVPASSTTLSEIIGEIKYTSARAVLEMLRRNQSPLLAHLTVHRNGIESSAIWMRRCYDRNCRSDAELWGAVRYCHDNPVNRGLVRHPEQWIWSSCRWYRGERDVPLDIDELP